MCSSGHLASTAEAHTQRSTCVQGVEVPSRLHAGVGAAAAAQSSCVGCCCAEPPNGDIFVSCSRPDGEAGWPSDGFDLQYSYAAKNCSDPTQPIISVTGTTKVSIRTTPPDTFGFQVTQDAPICPNDAIGGFTLAYAGTLTATLRNFAGGNPPVSVCNASTTVLGECGLHTGTAEQDEQAGRQGSSAGCIDLRSVLARLPQATDRKHCCPCWCVGGRDAPLRQFANQHSPELGVPPSSCCPVPTTALYECAAPLDGSVSVSCQRPTEGWTRFFADPDIDIPPTPCGTASSSGRRVEVVEIEFTKRPSSRGYCALDESVALSYEYTSQLRAQFGVEATGGVVCTPDFATTEQGPLLGAALTSWLQACPLVCASSCLCRCNINACMQHSHL